MEAIVERIVEKCIQSEFIEESQRDWMAYSLQRKFLWRLLYPCLFRSTCCAVTASDSFEFWIGIKLLLAAKGGSKPAFEELFGRYKNLLRKYSVINGIFDDDLYQEQCVVFVHCIKIFEVK